MPVYKKLELNMTLSPAKKTKSIIIFALYALCLGALIGAFIWAFLWVMGKGIGLVWDALPAALFGTDHMSNVIYTVAICLVGGVVIGVFQKKFGQFPENMESVMAKVKRDGRYPYDKTLLITLMALLPLVFGGSLGPEAGLTGVIVGLCYWAGDHFKYAKNNIMALAQIGISATIGVVFRTPLFGFIMPIESRVDEDKSYTVPKASKTIIYLVAILGGVGVFFGLSSLIGGGMSFASFSAAQFSVRELIFAIPCAIAGFIGALIFSASKKVSSKLMGALGKKYVLKAVIGGAVLAVLALVLPYMQFSGEAEMGELMLDYKLYTAGVLLLIGALKAALTAFVIESGWRGGHFFPIIFSGVAIGYGVATLFGCDPVFCVMVTCAALVGATLKKPVAAAMLLLLCFPISGLLYMIPAVFLGSVIPMPCALKG